MSLRELSHSTTIGWSQLKKWNVLQYFLYDHVMTFQPMRHSGLITNHAITAILLLVLNFLHADLLSVQTARSILMSDHPPHSSCVSSAMSLPNNGWFDKIDQTLFSDQTSVWNLICINFSSDDKHSVLSSRSVQNSVWSTRSDQISSLRPNLTWTIRSNRQLHNVKIQTFAANL